MTETNETTTETKLDPIKSITFSSDTKDDRHNKQYYRKLDVHVTLQGDAMEQDLPHHSEKFPVPKISWELDKLDPKPRDSNSYGDGRRNWAEEWTVYLTYYSTAEKPSEIVSEEEAILDLDHKVLAAHAHMKPVILEAEKAGHYEGGDALKTLIRATVGRVIKRQEEIRWIVHLQRQTVQLGAWIAKEADEEARKVVRFKQRMAALVAELEEEQKIQLATMLEKDGKLDKGVAEHNNTRTEEQDHAVFDPQSVKLTKEFATRFMPSPNPSGFLLARAGQDTIKLEEITLADKEAE